MNKNMLNRLVILILTGFLIIYGISVISANNNNSQYKIGEKFTVAELELNDNVYLIDYQRADVTGNGFADDIFLVGTKIGLNDIFADNLTVVVYDGKINEYIKATYDNFSGYDGKLFIGDFTADQVDDVFVSAATGGSGGFYAHLIATFATSKSEIIFAENENQGIIITGKYIDNFQAKLDVTNLDKEINLDISANKTSYIEAGIYDDNGRILKEITPYSYPFSSLTPVDRDLDGVYDLLGLQRVVGAYNADTISIVESIWKYKNSSWSLRQAQYSNFLLK